MLCCTAHHFCLICRELKPHIDHYVLEYTESLNSYFTYNYMQKHPACPNLSRATNRKGVPTHQNSQPHLFRKLKPSWHLFGSHFLLHIISVTSYPYRSSTPKFYLVASHGKISGKFLHGCTGPGHPDFSAWLRDKIWMWKAWECGYHL